MSHLAFCNCIKKTCPITPTTLLATEISRLFLYFYPGTKTEFSNMFERPIQNGQCVDSTPRDRKLMMFRAHVLYSQLQGFVQRRSHRVLRQSLPKKFEHVLLVSMSPLQRRLYATFIEDLLAQRSMANPLKAFAVCCKIWNHPDVLCKFLSKFFYDHGFVHSFLV